MDKARLQKTSKVTRHKDKKIDHSVIPVKKVLTVEDGLENQLTGMNVTDVSDFESGGMSWH